MESVSYISIGLYKSSRDFCSSISENPAFEIYTPMTTIDDESHESLQNRIKNIEDQSISVIKNIGGNSSEEDVLHYDIWKYFYHVSLEDFKAGYFDELEKMQGQHNTFYNMGINSFELIEPIARYSKYLVDRYYIGKIES
ncbi:MAG: hypothetical protein IPJ43_17955 [Saprospiraceae bacterium]|nr:hypothetical protein [Saprospiraceae bacterium]